MRERKTRKNADNATKTAALGKTKPATESLFPPQNLEKSRSYVLTEFSLFYFRKDERKPASASDDLVPASVLWHMRGGEDAEKIPPPI